MQQSKRLSKTPGTQAASGRFWGLFAATLALTPMAARAAPSLDAYALSAGGNSRFGVIPGFPFSCSTFGPDTSAAIYRGGAGVGLPSDGSVCGVATDRRTISGVAGPVQVASSLAVGFGPPTDLRSFVGSSAGRAAYGNLGVSAAASYGGNSDSGTVSGSQAGARQVETMTFAGASGTGTYRPTFTIDGSFFGVGRTYSEIDFGYAAGTGSNYLAFRLLNAYGTLSLIANGGYQTSLPGMAITGDAATGYTVSGSTTFAFDVPITFGVPLDIAYMMWAVVLPVSSTGLLSGSSGNVSFLSTARLTGIQVYDNAGQALNTFSVSAVSGTLYGPGGVVAVPEPASWALMAVGLAALGLRRNTGSRCAGC